MVNNKVFCYRNLNRKGVVWSVRSTKTGLVIDRATNVVIKNPEFVVSQKGRDRVLKEQRKNVHAGIRGQRLKRLPSKKNLVRVGYNPYKSGHFALTVKNTPIYCAKYAILKNDGLWVIL